MPDDTLLIATLGQNDLHIVVRMPDGSSRRHPLRKDFVRAFHEDCLKGTLHYLVTPFPETGQLERRDREELEYLPDCRTLLSVETFGGSSRTELSVDPRVEVCAPLLAEVWEQIRNKIAAGQWGPVRAVLLLNTRRDERHPNGQPLERGEPVGAGAIVRQTLVREFGLPGEELVEECFFLTAGDLYEIDSHNQRHLRADAARVIDNRIRALRNRFPGALPLVSDIGGFPETKAVLHASVAYRFEGRFELVRPVERGRATAQRGLLLIAPSESLTTRHQIRRLIQRGSFDAAAELAKHPAGDEAMAAEPWRRSVVATAEFLRTGSVAPCGGETKKVLDQLSSMPRSLVILFRIEAALRRGDFETAICDTVTFAELALLELADAWLSAPGESCVNWTRSVVVSAKTVPDFQQHNEEAEYRIDFFHGRQAIASWLAKAPRIAWNAVFKATNHNRVRRARNESVHARATEAHVQSAVEKLLEDQLWSLGNEGMLSILKADLPKALFAALGFANPHRSYREALQAIRDDMDQETESV